MTTRLYVHSMPDKSSRYLESAIKSHTPYKETWSHNTYLHSAVIIKRSKVIASAENRFEEASLSMVFAQFIIQSLHFLFRITDTVLEVF